MLSVGLVGLPNAGKSTLFNLLTQRSVPAENFPFCTIDPHDGIVEVPDLRVKKLAQLVGAQKELYAAIEFRDIAGLVKNAAQGAGLGNQFLAHIQEVDLILLTVRAFLDDNVIHVENRVNPKEDEEILLMELIFHDQNRLEKLLPRLQKEAKNDRYGVPKISIVESLISKLSTLQPANSFVLPGDTDEEILKWRKQLNLLTDKPLLRLANISTDRENAVYESDFALDILLETELADMTAAERQELGAATETGLDLLIRECYHKLNLATFLTCGEKESRAWTFTQGMSAPQCAGKIHTDFEKKFIKAEVVKYDDFVQSGSWKACWDKGLVKTLGKDYIFQDGDVVEFKIGG